MRCVARPNVDQLSRDQIEDLGLTEVDVFIKRKRINTKEQRKKK